jgi:hypothetical protein
VDLDDQEMPNDSFSFFVFALYDSSELRRI